MSKPLRGWVYVVTNKAMPGLVKVGFSLKDPQIRVREFDSAALPYPYEVVYEALIDRPRDVEQAAHALLKEWHENREWFRCSGAVAIDALRRVAGNRYHETVANGALPSSSDHPQKVTPPRPRDPSRFNRARADLEEEWLRRGVPPVRKR